MLRLSRFLLAFWLLSPALWAAETSFSRSKCMALLARVFPQLSNPEMTRITLDNDITDSKSLRANFDHYKGVKKVVLDTLTPRRITTTIRWFVEGEFTAGEALAKDHLPEGVTFNVVLKGRDLFLSRSGEGFLRDLISKHAVLANHQDVHFAGKLRRVGNEIYLINDSGTYRPTETELQNVAAYLSTQLGDYNVQPKKYKAE